MESDSNINIRTLPRGRARPDAQRENASFDYLSDPEKSQPMGAAFGHPAWIYSIYTIGIGLLLLGGYWSWTNAPEPRSAKNRAVGSVEMASVGSRLNESINRHLRDTEIQSAVRRNARELENLKLRGPGGEMENLDYASLTENVNQGVQLETDRSAERIYDDLYTAPMETNEILPVDRINARLAKRKWLTERERAENIQFIKDIVLSAYAQGCEVQIDQNLMIVGCKPVNSVTRLNINQVIDRLAKQSF